MQINLKADQLPEKYEKRTVANKSAKEENPTHVLNHFVSSESWKKDKSDRTRTNTRERNEPRS